MSEEIRYFFDISTYRHSAIFSSINYPWEALNRLNAYLFSLELGKIEGLVSPDAYLINPEQIYIGKNSVVEPGAYLCGPCWIGDNCTVRHGAYVRGNLLTGDHCVIGHDTEIKNAIFLTKTHAAHFSYIGDSIIGNGVNMGAGSKCANFKLDQQLIDVRYKTEKIATFRRKMGAIIGDHSQIGCNTVLNPGTLVGQQVMCYPTLNVYGWIPSRSILKPESGFHVEAY